MAQQNNDSRGRFHLNPSEPTKHRVRCVTLGAFAFLLAACGSGGGDGTSNDDPYVVPDSAVVSESAEEETAAVVPDVPAAEVMEAASESFSTADWMVSAGADQVINDAASATVSASIEGLDASVAAGASYQWRVLGQPEGAEISFSDEQSMQTDVLGLEVAGLYRVQVEAKVIDAEGLAQVSLDEVLLMVSAVEAAAEDSPAAEAESEVDSGVVTEETAEPTVEETPVAEEAPVEEDPVTAEPVGEEPVAEEPVTEESVTEESVTEEPGPDVPVATIGRLFEVVIDADQNGMPDARRTFAYDAAGRIVTIEQTYMNDDEDDSIFSLGLHAVQTQEFTYDALGRLATRTDTFEPNPALGFSEQYTAQDVYEYEYAATGDLNRIQHSSYDLYGGRTKALTEQFYYVGDKLKRFVQFDFELPNSDMRQGEFSYRSDGLPRELSYDSGNRMSFEWAAGGALVSTQARNFGSVQTQTLEYDADLNLVRSISEAPELPFVGYYNATIEYVYSDGRVAQRTVDFDNDGGVDVSETYRYEEAPCVAVYQWDEPLYQWESGLLSNFVASELSVDSAITPGTGFARIEGCVQ